MPSPENTTPPDDYDNYQSAIIRTMHTDELLKLQEAIPFEQAQLEEYRKLIGREVLRRLGNHEQI